MFVSMAPLEASVMRVFLQVLYSLSLLDLVEHWDGLHESWAFGFRLGILSSVSQRT